MCICNSNETTETYNGYKKCSIHIHLIDVTIPDDEQAGTSQTSLSICVGLFLTTPLFILKLYQPWTTVDPGGT